ncbi:MAG: hypothetical protein V4613_03170 [Bacteroidota bacterium]
MHTENNTHTETLSDIKNLMERSTRFISLSGISGITTGIIAITGVVLFCYYYSIDPFSGDLSILNQLPADNIINALLTAFAILVLSIGSAVILSVQKSRKMKVNVWGNSSKRFLINFFLPLIASGIFCLLLAFEIPDLVLPLSLIFYGMVLFNAGNYTISVIRSLGVIEMLLGIFCLVFINYHIVFWTIGFGVMHIIYGFNIYFKSDRNNA